MNIYIIIFITLTAALIASIAQVMYKRGLDKKITGMKDLLALAKKRNIIIGLVMYFISLVVYLFALKNAPLSFVYPLFASTFIFVFFISSYHLKEPFSKYRVLGIFLIFVGIVIVSISTV